MPTERIVDRLDSVFDLRIHKALNLSERVSVRIMLTYSKKDNSKRFKVLNPKTTEEMEQRITSWLDRHIDIEDLLDGLGSSEIDMDSLTMSCNG